MSQIITENDDNCSVAASDFVQLDHPDEEPDQQDEQQQFGFQQNPLGCTMGTGSTHNYYKNCLKEQKLMIEKLEAKVENLELKAEIRVLKENAEQNAKYQAQETKFAEMLSKQNEEHKKEMKQLKDEFAEEMSQLEARNHKPEEKLMSNVEVQTTKTLDAKMKQLQVEFSKMLAEHQAQFHSLEQKLKETGQKAQTWKNEKLDYMWGQLMMSKRKILAHPKGIVWDRSQTDASISECGLKLEGIGLFEWCFASKGCAISAEHCRKENFQFSGALVYYYEVTITNDNSGHSSVGFTDGSTPRADRVGYTPNSYGIAGLGYKKKHFLWLSGKKEELECQTGAIARANVVGSGLLLNSKDELAVFFTLNGILLVKQTRINPTVDRLYPTVCIHAASVETNFGDNLVDKPFQYDVDKCEGLVFE